jgi:hypothetical protein
MCETGAAAAAWAASAAVTAAVICALEGRGGGHGLCVRHLKRTKKIVAWSWSRRRFANLKRSERKLENHWICRIFVKQNENEEICVGG